MQKKMNDHFFFKFIDSAPIGILIFDSSFKVTAVNDNFFRFKGVRKNVPDLLVGNSVLSAEVFEKANLEKEIEAVKKGEIFEKPLFVSKTIKGEKLIVLIKGAPIYDDDEFKGGLLLLEDIKEQPSAVKEDTADQKEYYSFLTNISHLFALVDPTGNIIYKSVNNKADFIKNIYNPNAKHIGQIFYNSDEFEFIEYFQQAKNSGSVIEKNFTFNNTNQNVVLRTVYSPYPASDPQVTAIFINEYKYDITESQENNAELTELQNYHQLTTKIIDAVVGIDIKGKITYWNEAAQELFKHSKSEVFGKFIGKVLPPLTESYFEKLKEEIIKNKNWQGEIRGERANQLRIYDVKIKYVEDIDNSCFVMLCSDVTERAFSERELRRAEERFRNIVTNSHEFICTLDLNGKITYANPEFIKKLECSKEELAKADFKDFIEENYLHKTGFRLKELSRQKGDSIEIPFMTKSGKMIIVSASFNAVLNFNNEPIYYNAILSDITQKKEAEKDLLLTRSVFEASKDGIGLFLNRKMILINDSFARMFGYKPGELIDKDPLDLVAGEDFSRIKGYTEAREKGLDAPALYQCQGVKKDGSRFYLSNSVSSYEIEKKIFILWVSRDITETMAVQNAIRESEEKYRSITENIDEAVWTAEKTDNGNYSVFYTAAIAKITGYSNERFINNSFLWHRIIHPDDLTEVISKLRRFYKDSSRANLEIEYRILNNLGNIIWIRNKINLIRGDKGEVRKIFGLVGDITIQKHAEDELKKSAESLKELNETKDRFLSIISHDLRTPFSSILGFTDILLNDDNMPVQKQKEYVTFIQDSSKSMLALVNSLLDWTRLQTGRMKFEPDRINASVIIRRAIQMQAGLAISKNISLLYDDSSNYYVHADDGLLLQIFNNLLSNAIKFTNVGGVISIHALPLVDKRQVRFSVKDNGVGIKEDDLPKLFKVDSKYTTPGTKGEKGTGLGLSLVYDIVQKHGGDIWVKSVFGLGSEIFFTIPISSTNILLVDDVTTDRVLYSKLFKSLIPGYTVTEAGNGREALEIIKLTTPALVITDHKMPVMGGYELVQQIGLSDLKIKPPVIILSSDITRVVEEEYKELGVEYVFQKPVNLNAFKLAIEKCLKKITTG